MAVRDPSLDTLLLLDGESFVVDANGKCWVKFVVKQAAVSPERPHGLDYSLTLQVEDGTRLLGFDNAQLARRNRARSAHPHRVRPQTLRPTGPFLYLRRCRNAARGLLDRGRRHLAEQEYAVMNTLKVGIATLEQYKKDHGHCAWAVRPSAW